jgi:molecular chaperone HtpG
MEQNTHQFQIHLPGLLKVLAENLYSTPKVAIRELLQNAHDSCVRRSVEDKNARYQPRVDIFINAEDQTIEVQDNGSGLTEQEVAEYLSTIGRSYTRQLGENLSILSPDMAEKLVGQFGLGFLSAFLVASEVTLTTRSMKPDSVTLQWHSVGDIHYAVKPIEEEAPVGTRVLLKVKPTAAYLLNQQILIETVQHYADFLPIPVHVESSGYPVNSITSPWEAIDPEFAVREYVARKFGVGHPLSVIMLQDHEVNLGYDTLNVPLRGFLFIPPGSVASIQEFGDLSIYIRRMFICDAQRDLLPPWARFIRGVVDCSQLQPTASREEIRREETFTLVQQAIEQQLTNALKHMAQHDLTTWKQVVRGHRDVIMGWAVKNHDFFDKIADIVTFRTTRGQQSLPEYLEKTGGTVYYVTHDMDTKQEQVLGEGFGVPVIDASRFSEPEFLQKYGDLRPSVQLVQLDSTTNRFMHPVPEADFAKLLQYFRKRNIRVQAVTFKPDVLPAIMMYPKEAEFVRDARGALDAGEIPGPFAGMVGAYISRMTVDEQSLSGTLYLNAANPLILTLTKIEDEAQCHAALELIYQMARLLAGRMLDANQITELFQSTNASLSRLIE